MANPRGFPIKIILIFVPTVLIAAAVIGIGRLDPMYGTDQVMEAVIVSQVSMVGKSGAKLEITVRASDGRVYRFNKTAFSERGIGDKVTLRLYERRITGLQSYKLERVNISEDSNIKKNGDKVSPDVEKLLNAENYNYMPRVE